MPNYLTTASINVNGNIYDIDASGIITLPNYPTTTGELTNTSGFITDTYLDNYLEKDTFKEINWSHADPNDVNITHKLTLNVDTVKNNEYSLKLEQYEGDSRKKGLSITSSGNIVIDTGGLLSKKTTLAGDSIVISAGVQKTTFFADHISISNAIGDPKNINYKDIITNAALTGYATETWVGEQGYANQTWVGEQGYQTASDVSTAVSTAISGQTKETWTFELADGSTVTKSVVLGA